MAQPRRTVILCIEDEVNAAKKYLRDLGEKAPQGEITGSAVVHRMARDQELVCVYREGPQESEWHIRGPWRVSEHWHATDNGGEPNVSTIARAMGPACAPLTIKQRDGIVRIAYA